MPKSQGPYRFAEEVGNALEDARTVALAASAPCVQPIHILLSLLKGTEVPSLLGSLLPVMDLRTVVAATIGAAPRARTAPSPLYSSRSKRVLENAITEARELRHPFVSPKHILLGILRMRASRRLFGILPPKPDPAYAVLVSLGLTYDAVRATVDRAA